MSSLRRCSCGYPQGTCGTPNCPPPKRTPSPHPPERYPEDAWDFETLSESYPEKCGDAFLRGVILGTTGDSNKEKALEELIQRAADKGAKGALRYVQYKMHEHAKSLEEKSRENFYFYADLFAGADLDTIEIPELPKGHCCKDHPHNDSFWGKR